MPKKHANVKDRKKKAGQRPAFPLDKKRILSTYRPYRRPEALQASQASPQADH